MKKKKGTPRVGTRDTDLHVPVSIHTHPLRTYIFFYRGRARSMFVFVLHAKSHATYSYDVFIVCRHYTRTLVVVPGTITHVCAGRGSAIFFPPLNNARKGPTRAYRERDMYYIIVRVACGTRTHTPTRKNSEGRAKKIMVGKRLFPFSPHPVNKFPVEAKLWKIPS